MSQVTHFLVGAALVLSMGSTAVCTFTILKFAAVDHFQNFISTLVSVTRYISILGFGIPASVLLISRKVSPRTSQFFIIILAICAAVISVAGAFAIYFLEIGSKNFSRIWEDKQQKSTKIKMEQKLKCKGYQNSTDSSCKSVIAKNVLFSQIGIGSCIVIMIVMMGVYAYYTLTEVKYQDTLISDEQEL